ncbi:hypothetical protein DMA11_15375 [Marinilabiliaceae bacterium JC017]|nr:hypothetical protein DMA11_15375 [Marinilabiliaceae bacterium JC017]
MRNLLLLFLFIISWQMGDAQSKRRPRVQLAGGAEYGWTHVKAIGDNYHQSSRSIRYYGELIYRYNGLNHVILSGGYSQDSLSFRNTNTYLTDISDGYGHMEAFTTNGLIKTKSAWVGAAYMLGLGSRNFGLDIQMGVSGRYIFEAVRYNMPDERFYYRLGKEIQPFNIVLQPRLALRISYLRLGVSYEVPLMDHINHDLLVKYKPYEHKSADMRGLRMDSPMLFLSASLALPVEKAIVFLSNAVEDCL